MTESADELRARVLVALQQSDDLRRSDRANRMIAVSPHLKSYGAVMGEADTLAMKNEAYDCFINGHFIATILLAVSFIEHTLSDSILEGGGKPPRSLEAAISTAREQGLFPDDLLNVADRLREIRNPFSHRKPPGHEHTFANRYRARDMHPTRLLEDDAKEALIAMYRFFDLSLRVASFDPPPPAG